MDRGSILRHRESDRELVKRGLPRLPLESRHRLRSTDGNKWQPDRRTYAPGSVHHRTYIRAPVLPDRLALRSRLPHYLQAWLEQGEIIEDRTGRDRSHPVRTRLLRWQEGSRPSWRRDEHA